MLTSIAIISIFTEIFTAGILIAGAYVFFNRGRFTRKPKDLLAGLFFLLVFIYVAAAIAAQMLFNMGQELGLQMLVYKIMFAALSLSEAAFWLFIYYKFNLTRLKWLNYLFGLLMSLFVFLVAFSSLNLISREGIIEPIADFAAFVPVEPLMAILSLALAFLAFTFKGAPGEQKLTRLLGVSGLILFSALTSKLLYLRFGESAYLLFSWFLVLGASIVFLIAESIAPNSPEALKPLNFLRTRILFKLLLVFILLIVILFEATTLATIAIGKAALSKSITNNYFRIASEVRSRINNTVARPGIDELAKIAQAQDNSQNITVFVVNDKGQVVYHPDKKRAVQNEDLREHQAVNKLLMSGDGKGEFRDELGGLMVGAYLPADKYKLGVVVQEPIATAYFELRKLETNSLLFVITGMLLTALAGVFFAKSIERPIKDLTSATEVVSQGNLNHQVPIESIDEIGKLADAFNRMTKNLRESQERLILSEKLASLGTMAAGMAHEIKNPLVSVRTFTQMLDKKWEDQEFRKKFMTLIPHEIERINRIAESLLKFGRPMKPELTHADVNALLDEVLMLFESESKKNNVRVTKKFAHIPEITGDPGQLQQAFVNFIKNAIESMQAKGGELVVKTDFGEVVKLGKLQRQGKKIGDQMVWGEEDNAGVPIPVIFIEITDSGEGIPEENLKSLFDPFFTTKMTGTGMGLPISLRIIEEHKGSIKVRSQKGKGTTFIITLPQKL